MISYLLGTPVILEILVERPSQTRLIRFISFLFVT